MNFPKTKDDRKTTAKSTHVWLPAEYVRATQRSGKTRPASPKFRGTVTWTSRSWPGYVQGFGSRACSKTHIHVTLWRNLTCIYIYTRLYYGVNGLLNTYVRRRSIKKKKRSERKKMTCFSDFYLCEEKTKSLIFFNWREKSEFRQKSEKWHPWETLLESCRIDLVLSFYISFIKIKVSFGVEN